MPQVGFDPRAAKELQKQATKISDKINIPGRMGALLKKIVEFLEPVPGQLTPLPPTNALVWGTGAQRMTGPLYHGTHSGVLDGILREGLRPATETGVRHYTGNLASRWPAVYLARDPLRAYGIAKKAAEKAGTEPVLLRVRELPVRNLLPDEDALYSLSTGKPFYPERYMPMLERSWPASFRLQHGVLREIVEKALLKSGTSPGELGAESFALMSKLRPRYNTYLGTVAHVGRIPSEKIEVVGVGEELRRVIGRESDQFQDLLVKALARRLQEGKNIPWWLK